jgi:hypothetical protein
VLEGTTEGKALLICIVVALNFAQESEGKEP